MNYQKTIYIPKVTLHFDTGINRLGIEEQEIIQVIEYCKKFRIKVFCVMSHFASADEKA